MTVLLSLLLCVSPRLASAEELLARARFEDVAPALAPLLTDEGAPAGERAAGEVLLGIACHNLLDEEGARAAFLRALELDRSVRLPRDLSPRTAALFHELEASLRPRPEVDRRLVPEVPPASPRASVRPTTRAGLIGAGVTVALGVVGGALWGVGLQGRALAVAELSPAGGIADLPALAARTTRPTVEVALSGDLEGLPPAVERAVFRVAQESITNAVRHARNATKVQVRIAAGRPSVRLSVRDDGETAGAARGAGFGLIGMAERAALLGGTFEAGPLAQGGWEVAAVFPRDGRRP